MNYYKVRITCEDIPAEEAINHLLSQSKLLVWSYEYKDKKQKQGLHLHFYVETKKTQNTLAQSLKRFVKKYGQSGNKAYSCVQTQDEKPLEYLAYIIKDGDYNIDMLPYETYEKVIEFSKTYKQKVKEKRKNPIWKNILERVKNEKLTSTYEISESVKYHIHKYHVEKEILIRTSTYAAYYNTIMAQLDSNFGFPHIYTINK